MPKFIHAADLHLDSPFKGLSDVPAPLLKQILQSTFKAFERLVQTAIEEQVDFVLLSGDIYDLEERSIKAQSAFRAQMEQLNRHAIPVFLIHGNHDFLEGETNHLNMPENVVVFGPHPETVETTLSNGEKVALSGFSYDQRWVTDKQITHYPRRSPQTDWHIGLLHGYAENSQSTHARYAPFTLEELKAKGYDYWALGHIHKRAQLSHTPLIYYSGNIQGRHKNEAGEKGFLLVELTETLKDVQFIPAAPIEWVSLDVDLTHAEKLSDIYETLEEKIQAVEVRADQVILSIQLQLSADLDASLKQKLTSNDLLNGLQQMNQTKSSVWLNDIKLNYKERQESHSIASTYEEEWQLAVEELSTQEAFTELLQDFFRNAPDMEMFPVHDESYRQEILDKASQLIQFAARNEE